MTTTTTGDQLPRQGDRSLSGLVRSVACSSQKHTHTHRQTHQVKSSGSGGLNTKSLKFDTEGGRAAAFYPWGCSWYTYTILVHYSVNASALVSLHGDEEMVISTRQVDTVSCSRWLEHRRGIDVLHCIALEMIRCVCDDQCEDIIVTINARTEHVE